ncbi:MAG: DUF2169 domain-containing protein [Anaeromyxobacter sp.]
MGHPNLENRTPYAFEPVFVSDEEGRPLLVAAVKGTWDLGPAVPALAEEQAPLELAGVPHGEDPASSSWRYEPEGGWLKPATDVVLVGSAVAPRPRTAELLVALQVGALRKGVRVLGDRAFYRSVASVGMTAPVPFERIPLQWERAFGGWDRSSPDERRHTCEFRNPVGQAFRAGGARFEDGVRCPNLEDPARPFKGWGDAPPPAGFGFVSPDWEPRRRLAGTYDQRWEEERAPLLPRDFSRRFLSAASAGLVAPGYLRGDEPVAVAGVTAQGGLTFKLPGFEPPRVKVIRRNAADGTIATQLDTVIIDTDAMKLFLIWKGEVVLQREPTEVQSLEITQAGGPAARDAA